MNLGNKIIKLRKRDKLSQEMLADKIGVSRQTISNWELNVTKPDTEYIKKISNVFGVSIDELLDNDIRDIMEKKISNTEKLTNKNTKNIKIVLVTLYFIILAGLIYIIVYYSNKRDFTNIYQNVYKCTLLEEDNIHDVDTGVYYLYWDINDDKTFSVFIELDYEDDDPVYDELEKGMYRHPIYGEFNAGNLIGDAVDSLIYFKNLLIYHGATCR